ncbi:phosphomethylpyrimidine synthase ThiC [Candidatus Omnitrophota bacterium]
MTLIEIARSKKQSGYMKRIAANEGVDPEFVRNSVSKGRIVIPANKNRAVKRLCGIGEGLRTKVNTNIGNSKDLSGIGDELSKMNAAIKLGTDAIMDLSTGKDIKKIRTRILKSSAVPVGTVPIYETVVEGIRKGQAIRDLPRESFFKTLEEQAEEGVDFFTIHAGVTRQAIDTLKKHPRILDIVSRGGAFLAEWILENSEENPYYEDFDRVLEIVKKYDVTLSLGDGLRPGAIHDATDDAQVFELATLGKLQKRALNRGVQVMIEGPGHVPINQVQSNVALEKSMCNRAPFYVLGPIVTDIAPGYDHISGAIGGAIAAAAGADFLCYITPSEHLRLPTIDDVREGVIASKIAAHAADIGKGIKGSSVADDEISRARKARDWSRQFALAIDAEKPKRYRNASRPAKKDVCTMCGEFCSIKQAEAALKR